MFVQRQPGLPTEGGKLFLIKTTFDGRGLQNTSLNEFRPNAGLVVSGGDVFVQGAAQRRLVCGEHKRATSTGCAFFFIRLLLLRAPFVSLFMCISCWHSSFAAVVCNFVWHLPPQSSSWLNASGTPRAYTRLPSIRCAPCSLFGVQAQVSTCVLMIRRADEAALRPQQSQSVYMPCDTTALLQIPSSLMSRRT